MYFFLIHTLLINNHRFASCFPDDEFQIYDVFERYLPPFDQSPTSDDQALFNQKECRGKLDATAIKNLGNDRFFIKYFNNET